jgi:hypothetical protein
MTIRIEDLKAVIDSLIKDILSQLSGKMYPKIDERVAVAKLGGISALCIELSDKVEDPELKKQIWTLKKESDEQLEKLFGGFKYGETERAREGCTSEEGAKKLLRNIEMEDKG